MKGRWRKNKSGGTDTPRAGSGQATCNEIKIYPGGSPCAWDGLFISNPHLTKRNSSFNVILHHNEGLKDVNHLSPCLTHSRLCDLHGLDGFFYQLPRQSQKSYPGKTLALGLWYGTDRQ